MQKSVWVLKALIMYLININATDLLKIHSFVRLFSISFDEASKNKKIKKMARKVN